MAIPSEASTGFSNPRSYTRLDSLDQSSASRLRLIFLRAIVWSLVGMIYAPLFTGLVFILKVLGFGHLSYVMAASVAGAVGAVLYGAREVSLISTGLGVAVGVATLISVSESVSLTQVSLIAGVLAAIVGITVPFPQRCSRNVPPKAVAGLVAGAFGGAILAMAEPLHPAPFSLFAMLAFLVSVNGVIYVATVRWWVALPRRLHLEAQPCYLIESLVMAVLAAVAAGSVWMVSAPLLNLGGIWQIASEAMHGEIQRAILGGLFGGGTAGMLLETFRFSWVHDL